MIVTVQTKNNNNAVVYMIESSQKRKRKVVIRIWSPAFGAMNKWQTTTYSSSWSEFSPVVFKLVWGTRKSFRPKAEHMPEILNPVFLPRFPLDNTIHSSHIYDSLSQVMSLTVISVREVSMVKTEYISYLAHLNYYIL